MARDFVTRNPELEKLFDRYRECPQGYVFAPLADACRKEGLLDEAIEICTNGLKLHPNYPSGHVVLGKCYYEKDLKDEALEAFRKVLSADPENLVALKFIGQILAERGDRRGAVEHFKRILDLDPGNKELKIKLKELGWNEENNVLELDEADDEDFEGAEIALGEEDAATSDELATVTLADIFASQGYREKAVKIYREVLSRDPGNELVKKKLKDLGVEAGSDEEERATEAEPKESAAEKDHPGLKGEWDGGEPETEEIDYDRALEDILEGDADSESAPGEEAEDRADAPPHKEETKAPEGWDGASNAPRLMDEKQSFELFKRWLKKSGE